MKTNKSFIIKATLVFVSLVFAIALFDLALMPFDLVFNSANVSQFNFQDPSEEEYKTISQEQFKQWCQADNALGHLPKMGKKFAYSGYGTQHNSFCLVKPNNIKRILMLGDSIAAIGNLERCLAELLPSQTTEIWNAGVFGYSTLQEVIFFERYPRKIKPDVVILEFCLNDFDGTPVVIKQDKKKTLVAKMYLGSDFFSPWLFKYSTTYRIWLSIKKSLFNRPGLGKDVKNNLKRLQRLGKTDGFKLVVVVYPLFLKKKNWPDSYRKQHKKAISILSELGISYFDATIILKNMLENNDLSVCQMSKGDFFHPSKKFSMLLARSIIDQGLFK